MKVVPAGVQIGGVRVGGLTSEQARNALRSAWPLSLYVHLPFCNTICYYCACNKIITANRGRSAKYVRYVGREIDIVSSLLEGNRDVQQLHWGGGTPTFLAHEEMAALMGMLRGAFAFNADSEKKHRLRSLAVIQRVAT